MKLSEPYGLVLESIGKISSNVPFMMPARIAATDAFEQIDEYIGSGPFVFMKDEWVPGSKVVYTKFEDYVPRSEPVSAASGYDGSPVVIMQPTDIALLSAFSLITAEKLRKIGMTVEVQAMDWSTLTSRRARRDPVADGGWNMFHTWWIGADVIDPMSIAFSGNLDKGRRAGSGACRLCQSHLA